MREIKFHGKITRSSKFPLSAVLFWSRTIHSVLRIRESGIRCLFDPGIRNRFFPDPESQTHLFKEPGDKFLGKKFHNSLKIDPNVFVKHFKNKKNLQFCEIYCYKKRYDNYFFSPLSLVAVFGSGIRDPGSGMGKNQDPGSRINIPDPQHCIHYIIISLF
jgi:hypothetical protein